ncbi:MAG: hypothetical protein WKF80_08710 [Thermomicrobiales bacterium]
MGLTVTTVPTVAGYSLARTCAPVWWSGGRSPDLDWTGGLTWVGREDRRVIARRVASGADGLLIEGGDAALDERWARDTLGVRALAPLGGDPTVARVAARHPGTHPFAHGSLYAGLLVSIVGQGVTVAAAATFQARLAWAFSPSVSVSGRDRPFWPLPTAADLADADPTTVRACGVTGRRAAALVAMAREAAAGALPDIAASLSDPEGTETLLRSMPLVGPWTARSALLWGVGADDAYPPGDAALLRAARRAYDDDGLDQRGLLRLSEGWRPSRGRAARLLWLDLLGTPPGGESRSSG